MMKVDKIGFDLALSMIELGAVNIDEMWKEMKENDV